MRSGGGLVTGVFLVVLSACGSGDDPAAEAPLQAPSSAPSLAPTLTASTPPVATAEVSTTAAVTLEPTTVSSTVPPTGTSESVPPGAVVEGSITQPPVTISPVWEQQVTGHDELPHRTAILIAATDQMIVAGTAEGWVVALDPSTGEEQWAVDLRGATPISEYEAYGVFPVIAGELVVVATSTGDVHALDAAGGEARWSTSLGVPVSGYPVVSAETVVVGSSWDGIYDDSAGYGEITATTTLGVFGLDVATGEVRWERPSSDNAQVSAASAGHALITLSTFQDPGAGSVDLVDVSTGNVVWTVAAVGPRTPAYWGEELVAVAAGSELVWLDHSGNQVSSVTCTCTTQFPVVAGHTVAVAGNTHDVYGVDAASGEVRWRHAIGDTYGMMFPGPEGIIAVGADSWLAWVDAASGNVVAGARAGERGGVYSIVSTANGEVAAAADGVVRLYRL
jgi:outer membrane protein assembly factor BamB